MKHKNTRPKKANRVRYENDLVVLINKGKKGYWAVKPGSSKGWDIYVFKDGGKGFCGIEVKTSISKTIYLNNSERIKKQIARYRRIKKNYNLNTYYAFRHIIKKGIEKNKWTFFALNNIEKSIKFDEGITFNEFLKTL